MKKTISIAVALAILAIACVFVFRGGEKPTAPEAGTTVETEAGQMAVVGKPSKPSRPSQKQAQPPRPKPPKPVLDIADDDEDDDDDDEVKKTPEEKALAKRIEKSLDDENLEAALACAKEALNCKNAEIRQAMVDTLGWFGEKALPELTPFLADPDDDVRESAMTNTFGSSRADRSTLYVNGGKLRLEGTSAVPTVSRIFVGGECLARGVYSSADCDWIEGDGEIRAISDNSGVFLIIR